MLVEFDKTNNLGLLKKIPLDRMILASSNIL